LTSNKCITLHALLVLLPLLLVLVLLLLDNIVINFAWLCIKIEKKSKSKINFWENVKITKTKTKITIKFHIENCVKDGNKSTDGDNNK